MAQRVTSSSTPLFRSEIDAGAKIRSPCDEFSPVASGGWARTFDVKEPIRHRKGYTLYKVISRVHPAVAPEAVTEIIVWKRYSDFKKLYKEITALHKNLHLKGKVPPFAKSQVFGRFDDCVIEARRRCAKELLDFVALHPPLFTSSAFSKFFEDDTGQARVVDERETLKEKPLIPLVSSGSDDSSDSKTSEDGDEFVIVPSPEESAMAGLSETGRSASEVPATPVITISTAPSTIPSTQPSLPPVTAFMTKSISTSSFLSGVWRYRQEEDTISLSSERSHSDEDLSTTSAIQGRSVGTPHSGPSSVGENLDDRERHFQGEELKGKLDAVGEHQELPRGRRSPSPSRRLALSDQRPGHYVFLAAEIVGSAQEAEAQEDFRSAFVKYKAGIGILLEGVQSDDNHARRDAVRRKTAQYLERAEHIYNSYLASSEEFSWDDGISPNFSSSLLHLQVPLIELSRYKVLGVVGSVLLVLDATSGRTCVIKVLQKSSASGLWAISSKRTIVPESSPHMVQLFHFHETPSSIFLVLEHAKGGRLWDYLHRYSKMKRETLGLGSNTPTNSSFMPVMSHEMRRTVEDTRGMAPEGERTDTGPGSYLDLFRSDAEFGEEAICRNETNVPSGRNLSGSSPAAAIPGRLGHRRCKSVDVGLSSPTHRSVVEPKRSFDVVGTSSDNTRRGSEGDALTVSGGEIGASWSQIIPEALVKRWSAEIVVAVASLHAEGVVCRDLNPANVLLGSGGQVLLSYFSEWNCINRDIPPRLIGSGYIAPEVVAGMHDKNGLWKGEAQPESRNSSRGRLGACDWWSVGALVYELVTGTKLADVHCDLNSHQVVVEFPGHVSREACGLVNELLRFNRKERLGTGVTGWEEVRSHPFFESVDWSELARVRPVVVP